MIKKSSHKGNNIVEYAILFLLVGFITGYALFSINPDTFKKYFKETFSNSTNSSESSFTIGPLGD